MKFVILVQVDEERLHARHAESSLAEVATKVQVLSGLCFYWNADVLPRCFSLLCWLAHSLVCIGSHGMPFPCHSPFLASDLVLNEASHYCVAARSAFTLLPHASNVHLWDPPFFYCVSCAR